VLKALYYLAPGVPVVGLLQARRERKCDFQVPGVVAEDVVGEWEDKCVAPLVSHFVVSVFPRLPAAGRVRPPFIDQGGSKSHVHRAI
jgi:hypothetical protein